MADACNQSNDLRTLLLRYVQTFTIQAAQGSAANAHYEVPQRLARWLLMRHDRVQGEVLELTHEFMAMMLGVRRGGHNGCPAHPRGDRRHSCHKEAGDGR